VFHRLSVARVPSFTSINTHTNSLQFSAVVGTQVRLAVASDTAVPTAVTGVGGKSLRTLFCDTDELLAF